MKNKGDVETVETSEPIKVYAYRWVVLTVFVAYYTVVQFQWLQYSIIANTISRYYNVSYTAVNWTAIIFMILYIPCVIPGSYILDKWGLRVALIVGMTANCLGAWIKVGSVSPDRFWVTFLGQTTAALSKVFAFSVPARLAAVWFGPEQVSTATSIGVFGNQLGIALGFLLPPIFVNAHGDIPAISHDLYVMFLTTGVVTTVIYILIWTLFVGQPPTPPSIAQMKIQNNPPKGTDYMKYKDSLKALFRNKSFVLLLLALGMTVGVFSSLATLLNQIILAHYPGGEQDAGRIGLCIVVAGMIGAVVCGLLLDKFKRFRETALGIYVFTLVGGILLTIILDKGLVWVYIVGGVLGFCVTGFLSIGFEFGTELTYPEPEGTSVGLLTASIQIFGIICTVLYSTIFENFGDVWANSMLCVILGIGAVLMFFTKSDLRRQAAQRSTEVTTTTKLGLE